MSIRGGDIGWASGVFPRTGFLGIALSGAGSADDARGGELAIAAAVFVGVVANGGVLEFAGRRFTARIVAAGGSTTTVTVFTFLDYAVPTLLACDSGDAFVINERGGVDTVAAEGGADVANGARAEVCDALSGGRVHDISGSSVAC